MLYDRPYMRQAPEPAAKQTSAVTLLLVVTISIFVLQQVLNVCFPDIGGRPNRFFTNWFAFSSENFKELKVWTIVSYAFLHSNTMLMHILGNMLGLFFFGRALEPLLGKQQFLVLYFSGAIVGALTYLLFHFNGGNTVVGASAAVFALVSFFCLRYPDQRVFIIPIPIPIKPMWLFWGLLGYSIYALVFTELPGKAHVAHSAHLGGFLVGVLYYRYIYNGKPAFRTMSKRPSIEVPEWFKRRKKTAAHTSYQVNRPASSTQDLQKEVDHILDKINASGFGSLSDKEKATLERAKGILRK